jgi:hypothetical protein
MNRARFVLPLQLSSIGIKTDRWVYATVALSSFPQHFTSTNCCILILLRSRTSLFFGSSILDLVYCFYDRVVVQDGQQPVDCLVAVSGTGRDILAQYTLSLLNRVCEHLLGSCAVLHEFATNRAYHRPVPQKTPSNELAQQSLSVISRYPISAVNTSGAGRPDRLRC